jgi:membrane-bound lytic murein transglycosylase D
MERRHWLAIAGLALGCAAPGANPSAPVPASAPEAVHAARQEPPPVSPSGRQPVLSDSLKATQDSVLDNAVLDQLAEAHAPASPPSQAGDPFDAIGATRGLDISTYADHDRVRYYLDFFRGPARARMTVWLGRLPVYEEMIRTRFQAEGIPSDLVYLGLIESGYSNFAVSRSRAVGMWQFMRATGRWMGLRVDRWVDERRDPVKATDAAARYLKKLAEQFGSYYLAAAAYNGGPGTVSRGLNRLDIEPNGGGDGAEELAEEELEYSDGHFFTLADSRYIRQETKDYVPKLIAAALIARDPMAYGFEPVPVGPPFPKDSIVVPDATGLDVIAKLADAPLPAILELNPHYLRKVTPPGTSAVVRLPAGTMDSVVARYASLPATGRVDKAALAKLAASDAPARARVHTVRKGETLGGIARKYRVSQAQLRSWNKLPKSGMIRVGQKLKVGASSSASARPPVSPSARSGTYLVRRGDTLSTIARRHGTSVQALMDLNRITSAKSLKAGQRLKIPA